MSKHVHRFQCFLRTSPLTSRPPFLSASSLHPRSLCAPSGFDVDNDLTHKNYFKILGIPQSFDVNTKDVHERFKSLQKEWHPDNHYSGESGTDPEKAAVISSLVNEAYKALKTPHTRAKHLLALLDVDEDPDMTPDFLAWVVEFRESIDDAEGDTETVAKLTEEVESNIETILADLRDSFSHGKLEDAASQTAQLKYMWRMRTTLEDMS